MGMFTGFREFLLKTNALALAVAVVIGAAVGKLVAAIVDDVIMPLVGLLLPAGDWRQARFVLSSSKDANGVVTENAIRYGDLLGKTIDFVVIAWVVFLLTKAFLKEEKKA
jgi:large conductance mechanosensitive channel